MLRLYAIYYIIAPFLPKSNMFHHGSSTYNIYTTYMSTRPARVVGYKHHIQDLNHQINH